MDDVLAQVGLPDFHAHRFQYGVQAQFLRDHALALGGDLDVPGAGDVGDYLVGLCRVLGEVEVPPGGGDVGVEQVQVIVQVLDGVGFDVPGFLLPALPDLWGGFRDAV